MLGRQGKHSKKFNHYLDQYFSQSSGDRGENLETAKVTFEMFKEPDKRIIIFANFLSSLKIGCQDCRHRRQGKRIIVHTSNRRPIPVNMTFAGGNICKVNDKLPQRIIVSRLPYRNNAVFQVIFGRKPRKDFNSWLEPSHELNLPIPFPILFERESLFFKNFENCIRRVTVLELGENRI
jgi:hypothetical protein